MKVPANSLVEGTFCADAQVASYCERYASQFS